MINGRGIVLNPQKQLKREREARFQSIYYAHYEHMLRYAKSIFANRGIPDPGDGRAEESVQEAFLHAWEHRDEMFSVPNPEGWLGLTFGMIHHVRKCVKEKLSLIQLP